MLIQKIVSFIAKFYLSLCGKTSFHLKDGHPAALNLLRNKNPLIHAFWHNQQVYLAYAHRNSQSSVMVSRSKDGEYIAQVMIRLGLNPVRGSSSKGGVNALREMIAILSEGGQVGFTPDGPRGPLYSVQMGVITSAKATGAPIIPTASFCSMKKVFKSWDKFQLPLPFSTNVVYYGKPLFIKQDIDDGEAQRMVREAIDQAKNAAQVIGGARLSWMGCLTGACLSLLYRVCSVIALPMAAPFLLLKFGFNRGFIGLKERLGFSSLPPSNKQRLWFHCASLGEWQALKPLLQLIENKYQRRVVLTVSTPEAKKIIQSESSSLAIFLMPLDLPLLIKPWIKKINPLAVFIVETEIWPNLISQLHAQLIPIFVVNGRLSEKSLKGWKTVKPFIHSIMEKIQVFLVRTPEDGRRFNALGALQDKIQILGNMKIDNLETATDQEKLKSKENLFGFKNDLVVVGGSLWPGEEKSLMRIWEQTQTSGLRLILAPRRLERLSEIESLLNSSGKSWTHFSRAKKSKLWTTDILLLDTLGDLKSIYTASDVAFVGGTLYPKGGQNPLEPASAKIPILFGPSMENFQLESDELVKIGAGHQVLNEDELISMLIRLSNDAALRNKMGQAAADYVKGRQGAASKSLEAIEDKIFL